MTREIQRKARAGAAAARRQSARQCRAAADRAGAAPRRAAPGGDHRVAADRPLSRSDRTPPARVPVRQRQSRGGDRLRLRARSRAIRRLWATGSTPTIASASCRRSQSATRAGALVDRISLALRRRPATSISSTRRCCCATDGGRPANMPAPCSTSPIARMLEKRAAPGAQDGRDRQADRRHRARFQQSARRGARRHRPDRAAAAARRGAAQDPRR